MIKLQVNVILPFNISKLTKRQLFLWKDRAISKKENENMMRLLTDIGY